jgi:predicted nucleic acid-binding protein
MKVQAALAGASRVFLDTAPVVYFVEEHPVFLPMVEPFFDAIDQGNILGVVGPVTLAECLVMPFRTRRLDLQEQFIELLTNLEGIDSTSISEQTGVLSGRLRASYNLQLPDALQIATAIEAGCDAFLTNDRMLSRVTDLRVVILADLEN